MKNGIHFAEYADILRFMIFDADVVVARNIEFDVLTIFAEMYRNGFLHRQHGSLYAGLDTICGVHQKVGGNHTATLISSDSFTDFIILNFGYLFLNSPSQSLFNTLVWRSFLKEFYLFKSVKNHLPHTF
jgi:hypothetical protein